ncbi:hypothetical protein CONPUDRAFT_132003 [Coniophora puteana RWD-64-598 SS2]|uniref:BTB domain-containing protein n=1 Tax=Coniophora puteana (strain RWD-64-598) TaxID=741705 RepID=A0A5M3M874_CONPW|nr:uncharacterized protein CONPUDRAFT_132003 [Coniophora puteana RWD-64-598 SS2]EIW75074.1 hypothetical protein CONPUDRAFT_132003 [Coniophora puteana RWD-64-598 SS2]
MTPPAETSLPPASSPFDHPKADLYLLSADGVYFRVFKLFLSLASPIFESMFELPQPAATDNTAHEFKDGLPVVTVSESSKTLDSFLRFCYPSTLTEDPDLNQLDDVVDVLEASRKYEVSVIEKRLGRVLATPEVLAQDPYKCFAIACRSEMKEEAELAAKYTLRLPLIPPMFPEIDMVTSKQLLVLLTYHSQCTVAVAKLANDCTPWMVAYFSLKGFDWLTDSHGYCPRRKYHQFGSREVPGWWADFMDQILPLVQDRPSPSTVRNFDTQGIIETAQKPSSCNTCPKIVRERLAQCVDLLAEEIEKATSGIKFEMTF